MNCGVGTSVNAWTGEATPPPSAPPTGKYCWLRTDNPRLGYTPATNGCSGSIPHPVVDMTPACDAHDICYGTCGSSRDICDANFRQDMLGLCAANWPNSYDCTSIANTMYIGVRHLGNSYYEAAQDEARDWEKVSCPCPRKSRCKRQDSKL